MDSPLALYRRYRPETFAEVIGQEHVTEPLRAALANNRVNHAYLFSGPRGCGKTTSARILARALNCEQAPAADPCGQCQSCQDLARNGPGSVDVIEIDAASHGGVDDARDLREKAFFAPVSSRYKVYIIDEAHMVTPQGFNALLKLVEEPPAHLRFIFATTEPEKVIGTIRSRTHHYPFRLIPPRLMSDYLDELASKEGVTIEPAALPLVVRAGGGSARDTLSILDQLLGGAGPEGVTHDRAVGLLGYTPEGLLDDVINALAAADATNLFGVVDRVIETGQDPRRFTEDLLHRLRDLVIVSAVPDAVTSGLVDAPEETGERLTQQAANMGPADLSRAADIVATGLTEMRGATAPRLLLELICARLLLPTVDGDNGIAARIDRLERRQSIAPEAVHAAVAPVPEPPEPASAETTAPEPEPAPQPEPQPAPQPQTQSAPVADSPGPVIPKAPPPSSFESSPPVAPRAPQPEPEPQRVPEPEPQAEPEPEPAGGLNLTEVRRLWPDVIEATKNRRRVAWMVLSHNCQVVGVQDGVLTLGFNNSGARESFVNGGSTEILRQSMMEVLGVDWRVECIMDQGVQPQGSTPASPAPRQQPPPRPAPTPEREREPEPEAYEPPPQYEDQYQGADPDDPVVDEAKSGTDLLQQALGAEVIEEVPNEPNE